jgi:hypothetical protein
MSNESKPIEGVIYDKDGQRVFTTNVDVLSLEMNDKLLVNSYRNTVYQKTLFLEIENIKESGIEVETQGYPYEPDLIDNALNSMSIEIYNRFGQEYYDELQKLIVEKDLAFLKNKPKF